MIFPLLTVIYLSGCQVGTPVSQSLQTFPANAQESPGPYQPKQKIVFKLPNYQDWMKTEPYQVIYYQKNQSDAFTSPHLMLRFDTNEMKYTSISYMTEYLKKSYEDSCQSVRFSYPLYSEHVVIYQGNALNCNDGIKNRIVVGKIILGKDGLYILSYEGNLPMTPATSAMIRAINESRLVDKN